ncbi:MAG: VanW family protein [Eubacterium sp.]|nr:VanW family protein [Eubacterium sp.]
MAESCVIKYMKKLKIFGIVLLVLLVLGAAGGAGYFAWYYHTYVNIDEVYPGISIGGMDVSGLTKKQVQDKLDSYVADVSAETVTLKVGKKEKTVTMTDLGISCATPEVADQAYDLGKSGNVVERIRTVYGLTLDKKDYPISFSFDEKKAKKKLKKVEKKFLAKKKDATIKRKDGKFVITKEVNGIDMDLDKNADTIIAALTDPDWDQKALVSELDYTEDKAKHTKKELSAIKDILGTFTTSYSGSPSGRCVNVANGARLINDTLLYPGDSFSVHDAVTPFNEENGYRLAGSYENGTTVQTYGGGICQVSTTLYNAVLRSELEVLERSNHSMTVHYVKLSEDAAISGEDKDFRFKNSLKNPIYIVGSTDSDDETITFTIYGKETRDKDRSIEFISETLSTNPPSEKEIKDNTLEEGKRIVEKEGRTGYSARLWKVIHEKGKEDVREQINTSYYISTPREVRVGTKKKETKKDNKKKDQTKDKKEESAEKKSESANPDKKGAEEPE